MTNFIYKRVLLQSSYFIQFKKNMINQNAYSLQIFKISSLITKEEKAENGEGYLTSRCAGVRGNTTYTPEAREVKLQSPDSLGKMSAK